MLEVIHAAQAMGYDVPESAADYQISRTPLDGRLQGLDPD